MFVIAVGALVAGACGPVDEGLPAGTDGTVPSVPDAEPAADPLDGDWDVVGLTVDGTPVELPDDRRVTVSIDGDRIGGVAACNSYGGTLDADRADTSGTFAVGEMSWTEMGCEPDVMDIEQAFIHALLAVDSYEVADGLLVFASDADTSFRLVRQEPIPDAELVGTTWVLDTYLSGDAASNTAAMESAFLEFGADGTLTGSTGCRQLEGEWFLEGTMLQIPVLSAIDDPTAGVCAPEHEQLDRLVIGVVESGVTVQIDGQRLTLTAPGGDGLSYRADG